MFDPRSRYRTLDRATFTLPDGREVPYVSRRFLPDAGTLKVIGSIAVTQGDRLDLLAARSLGDPEKFWHLCDANNAMNPFDLAGDAAVGSVLQVPLPVPGP